MKDSQIIIKTERFVLKELRAEDASYRYLNWFEDIDIKANILTSSKMKKLEDLKLYISDKYNANNIIFLGIFCINTGAHIGNIKYEPIDFQNKYAILGILIGDKGYRGKKVGVEVIKASGGWLNESYGVSTIVLEVSPTNIRAINAYKSSGFIMEESEYTFKDSEKSLTMVCHI